jgi:hypothetical protein
MLTDETRRSPGEQVPTAAGPHLVGVNLCGEPDATCPECGVDIDLDDDRCPTSGSELDDL